MNLGCWNGQGIRTKDTEVFQELVTHNMDITVLTETKKKGKGNEIRGKYIISIAESIKKKEQKQESLLPSKNT